MRLLATLKYVIADSLGSFKADLMSIAVTDCSSCFQGWHKQLLGSGVSYSFTLTWKSCKRYNSRVYWCVEGVSFEKREHVLSAVFHVGSESVCGGLCVEFWQSSFCFEKLSHTFWKFFFTFKAKKETDKIYFFLKKKDVEFYLRTLLCERQVALSGIATLCFVPVALPGSNVYIWEQLQSTQFVFQANENLLAR